MGLPVCEDNSLFADDRIPIDISYMTREITKKEQNEVNLKKTKYKCIVEHQQDLVLDNI